MSRFKKGLDYFSLDIDFFDDEKVEFISARFGIKGEITIIRLLCRIYRNGYFLEWNDDVCLLFAKRASLSPALVNEIVAELVKRTFFNERLFNSLGILTSRAIQERYFEVIKRRQDIEVSQDFLLINTSKYKNVNIKVLNVDIKTKNVDIQKQSKVKESKVKNKEIYKERFEIIYKEYPNRDSLKKAKEHFIASVKTDKDWQDINTALVKYKKHLTVETWLKPKSASTWFNNWRDWVDYIEPQKQQEPQPKNLSIDYTKQPGYKPLTKEMMKK